jgi:hypothetical protein
MEAAAANGAGRPAARWTREHRLALWILLGAATLARVILAWRTKGVTFDIRSAEIAGNALREHGLHAYSVANADANRWPYPPGFLPVAAAMGELHRVGIGFATAIRVPAALADAGIAWLAQDMLGRRGAEPRLRLAAAAAVALGPVFWLTSGYHGQIDAVAILPALAALWVWTREPEAQSRALAAGLLIGLGCAMKTVPIVMLAALLPSSRSVREGVVLVAAAIAVPLAALLPFLLADPDGARRVFQYRGAPGLGGLSLVAQPQLPESWITGAPVRVGGFTAALRDAAGPILAVGLAGTALLLLRLRARPMDAAILVWLTVYAFGVNFFVNYFVWGLPFLIVRGRVRLAIAVQLAVLPGMLVAFHDLLGLGIPSRGLVRVLYTPALLAYWAACAVGMVLLARRLWRERPAPAPAGRPAASG